MNFATAVKLLQDGKPVYHEGTRIRYIDDEFWIGGKGIIKYEEFMVRFGGNEFDDQDCSDQPIDATAQKK